MMVTAPHHFVPSDSKTLTCFALGTNCLTPYLSIDKRKSKQPPCTYRYVFNPTAEVVVRTAILSGYICGISYLRVKVGQRVSCCLRNRLTSSSSFMHCAKKNLVAGTQLSCGDSVCSTKRIEHRGHERRQDNDQVVQEVNEVRLSGSKRNSWRIII